MFVRPSKVGLSVLHPTSFHDKAKYLLSTLHIRVWLPTSSNKLSWPASEACSSHLLGKHVSCPPLLALQKSKCAIVATSSRVSHVTGPAGPLTCLQALNLKNLLPPCFLLLRKPFQTPFCPGLRGHGRELLIYSKTIHFQEPRPSRTLKFNVCTLFFDDIACRAAEF